MKTYKERTGDVMWKILKYKQKQQKNRKIASLMVCLCIVIAAAAVLFVPYEWTVPNAVEYRNDPYYKLINTLYQAQYRRENDIGSGPKNNYEYLQLKWHSLSAEEILMDPSFSESLTEGSDYVEVTDNQVQGVIEGDLFKRTQKHIFYLAEDMNDAELSVYSIAGQESRWVKTHRLELEFSFVTEMTMYLSEDGSIATVIAEGAMGTEKEDVVCLVTLDVSNPTRIKELGRQYMTGEYVTSRKVGDAFILVNRFSIKSQQLDFSDKDTYLPRIGQLDDMKYLEPEAIMEQNHPGSSYITTVLLLSEKDGVVLDTAACLASSNNIYVSENCIFLPVTYSERDMKQNGETREQVFTEILCLSYDGNKLKQLGNTEVEGSVHNQYSMDAHNGMLRVVTTTFNVYYELFYQNRNGEEVLTSNFFGRKHNANLYCINMETWQIEGKVEAFAPKNESVESVRFDGDTAYVCTAKVRILTDPVYFFDLSDPANITWKDTGTIDGYSSSLVNFGNYLLGIGYGETRALKVEVYREAENSVESVCIYDGPAQFATSYKAYMIDRENGFIGIPVQTRTGANPRLLLLHFDGEKLNVAERIEIKGYLNDIRSVIIDGWLYTIGDTFVVTELK